MTDPEKTDKEKIADLEALLEKFRNYEPNWENHRTQLDKIDALEIALRSVILPPAAWGGLDEETMNRALQSGKSMAEWRDLYILANGPQAEAEAGTRIGASLINEVKRLEAENIAQRRELQQKVYEQPDFKIHEVRGALHASAPPDMKCSDCSIEQTPCVECYYAWWRKRHPNAHPMGGIVEAFETIDFNTVTKIEQLQKERDEALRREEAHNEFCSKVHKEPLLDAVEFAGFTEEQTQGPTGGGGIDHPHTIRLLGKEVKILKVTVSNAANLIEKLLTAWTNGGGFLPHAIAVGNEPMPEQTMPLVFGRLPSDVHDAVQELKKWFEGDLPLHLLPNMLYKAAEGWAEKCKAAEAAKVELEQRCEVLLATVGQQERTITELRRERDTPEILDFVRGVVREAAHQRHRWGAEHDASKAASDWYWLIGRVAGKALNFPDKRKHHIITTAAVCLNWLLNDSLAVPGPKDELKTGFVNGHRTPWNWGIGYGWGKDGGDYGATIYDADGRVVVSTGVADVSLDDNFIETMDMIVNRANERGEKLETSGLSEDDHHEAREILFKPLAWAARLLDDYKATTNKLKERMGSAVELEQVSNIYLSGDVQWDADGKTPRLRPGYVRPSLAKLIIEMDNERSRLEFIIGGLKDALRNIREGLIEKVEPLPGEFGAKAARLQKLYNIADAAIKDAVEEMPGFVPDAPPHIAAVALSRDYGRPIGTWCTGCQQYVGTYSGCICRISTELGGLGRMETGSWIHHFPQIPEGLRPETDLPETGDLISHAYVIAKGKRFLAGHSYGSGVGYSFSWAKDIIGARQFTKEERSIAEDLANTCGGKVRGVGRLE